jgi:hypothetical protein
MLQTSKGDLKMKKLTILAFAVALMMSSSALAQDTTKHDDMKTDDAKAEKMSKRAVSMLGKVGDDGKTFVSDKDNKTWKVSNPDVLKGHEGHRVRVRAHVDKDKDEIQVMSVRMPKSTMKKTLK